jgi:hypothetical protein
MQLSRDAGVEKKVGNNGLCVIIYDTRRDEGPKPVALGSPSFGALSVTTTTATGIPMKPNGVNS